MDKRVACAVLLGVCAFHPSFGDEPGLGFRAYYGAPFVTQYTNGVLRTGAFALPKHADWKPFIPETEKYPTTWRWSVMLSGRLEVPEDGVYAFKSKNPEMLQIGTDTEVRLIGDSPRRMRGMRPTGPVHLKKGVYAFRRYVINAHQVWTCDPDTRLWWKRPGAADFAELRPEDFTFGPSDAAARQSVAVGLPLEPLEKARSRNFVSFALTADADGCYCVHARGCGGATLSVDGAVVRTLGDRHDNETDFLHETVLPLHLARGRHVFSFRGTNVLPLADPGQALFWVRRVNAADDPGATFSVEQALPGESVFRKGEEIAWTVRRSTLGLERPYDVRLEVFRQRQTNACHAATASLAPGRACAVARLAFPDGLDGVFEYRFTDADGRVLEGPWQFAVIDTTPPPRAKGGAVGRLTDAGTLVDEIDCSEGAGGVHSFRDNKTSRVGVCGVHSYRQTGRLRKMVKGVGRAVDWFGYTLRVKHPRVAHVAVFSMPNDAYRRFPIVLLDPRTGRRNGASTEILPSGTPGLVEVAVPFWPNDTTIDVLLMPSSSAHGYTSTEAAVAQIRLYEFPDGFPALPEAACGWNPARSAGWYGEQIDLSPEIATTPPLWEGERRIPGAFSASFGFYYDYTALVTAWQRWGEYSAFQGISHFQWPLYSYEMNHLKTDYLPWGNAFFRGTDGYRLLDKYERNTLKIILLMCEKYGVRLHGDLQLNMNVGGALRRGKTPADVAQRWGTTDYTADTVRLLCRSEGVTPDRLEGVFLDYGGDLGGALNPAHPVARSYLKKFYAAYARACRGSSSFRGMNVRQWSGCSSLTSCTWGDPRGGYDDWTLGAFARETGRPVPPGAAQLKDRMAFFATNAPLREAWRDWRSDKVASLRREILAAMRVHIPDLTLTVTYGGGYDRGLPDFDLGLDDAKMTPDMGFNRRTASIARYGDECGTLDPKIMEGFDIRPGVTATPEQKQRSREAYPAGICTATGMYAGPETTRAWALALAEGPLDHAEIGMNWALPGVNDALRAFLRAYRALPSLPFKKVEQPLCDPDFACFASGDVAYFVNVRPRPVAVDLGAEATDLVTGAAVRKLELAPYALALVRLSRPFVPALTAARQVKLTVHNPSGTNALKGVVATFRLGDALVRGGVERELRLFRGEREIPLQVERRDARGSYLGPSAPESPSDDVAFAVDFAAGERAVELRLQLAGEPRPSFPSPIRVTTKPKATFEENWTIKLATDGWEAGFSSSSIGYLAVGGKTVYDGLRAKYPRNQNARMLGAGLSPEFAPDVRRRAGFVAATGPVRTLVVSDTGTTPGRFWRNYADRRLFSAYPWFDGALFRHVVDVRADGEMRLSAVYAYEAEYQSLAIWNQAHEVSWRRPTTDMSTKRVYTEDHATGRPYVATWEAKPVPKGGWGIFDYDTGSFRPHHGPANWVAIWDDAAAGGWAIAASPAHAPSEGAFLWNWYLRLTMKARGLPEKGEVELPLRLKLLSRDPGAEGVRAWADSAFVPAPTVVFEN